SLHAILQPAVPTTGHVLRDVAQIESWEELPQMVFGDYHAPVELVSHAGNGRVPYRRAGSFSIRRIRNLAALIGNVIYLRTGDQVRIFINEQFKKTARIAAFRFLREGIVGGQCRVVEII